MDRRQSNSRAKTYSVKNCILTLGCYCPPNGRGHCFRIETGLHPGYSHFGNTHLADFVVALALKNLVK
jgi:hypothetical protein